MSAVTMTAATVSRWMMERNVSASRPFPTPCCAGGSGRQCCRWTENWKRPCSTAWTPSVAPSAGRCSPPAPTGPNTARNVRRKSIGGKRLSASAGEGYSVDNLRAKTPCKSRLFFKGIAGGLIDLSSDPQNSPLNAYRSPKRTPRRNPCQTIENITT